MKVGETYRRLRKVALAQNYVSGRWMRLRRGGKTPTTSRCAMPHFPFDCPRLVRSMFNAGGGPSGYNSGTAPTQWWDTTVVVP